MTDFCVDKFAKSISSVGKSAFHEEFAEFLRSILPFENIISLVFNGNSIPAPIMTKTYGTNVFARLESYLSATYLLDPVYHFHIRRERKGIYWLKEMAPDNFLRSRYHEWYYGRIGILDEITIFQPVNETTTITISMGTDTASGKKFSAKQEKTLKRMAPAIHSLVNCDWDIRKRFGSPVETGDSLSRNLQGIVEARHGVTLSGRQAQVAIMILRGHSSPSIALELGISPQTVKVFRRQLYAKCGISSQSELFRMMLPLLRDISASFATRSLAMS